MLRNEESVFTKLLRISEIARNDTSIKFTSLAHLLTPDLLWHSLDGLNQNGAPGIDNVTVAQYTKNAQDNVEKLHQELKGSRYKATSVRRVYIPKANGKLRPLGIPTVKDRVVQRAVAEIVGTIYEPYFLEVSYGFRPKRSAHDALQAIEKQVNKNPVNWIVDVDIRGYFDHVNHEWMMKFLGHRIGDKALLRIIAKWLKAGILDNGVVVRNEEGTPQGGPISPLLANIYLHYVLDMWFEHKYKRTLKGYSFIVRYADDFVVGFERKEEAEQFLKDLKDRFKGFNLEIAEEKTQLVLFGRRSVLVDRPGPKEHARTFNFLGFTHYMRARGKGSERKPMVAKKPKRESRNKFLKNVKDWLWTVMHRSLTLQKKGISARLKGFYNYFGLRHCLPALKHVKWHVERIWIQVLRRRGQKHRLWWTKVKHQKWFALPEPKLI